MRRRRLGPGARRGFLPGAALLALAATDGTAATRTDPWSRFRGPNGSGVSRARDLPSRLDPEHQLVWRAALPSGHSSPVLSADSVYLTALDGETLITVALERETGRLRWRRAAPRPRQGALDSRNHPAAASPAVDEEGLVVFFQDFGLLAYDHAGEEQWSHPLGPFNNLYGMGASPVLAGDLVLQACDQSTGSYLVALDREDGHERWKVSRPEARSGHCTPILWNGDDRQQLLLPGSFLLTSYDVRTGERLWWVHGLSFEMKSVPVLQDDVVYVNGYGSPLNQPGNQVEVPPFAEVVAGHDQDGDGRIGPEEMPPSRAQDWFQFVDLDASGGLDAGEWDYLTAALASQNGLLAIRAGGAGNRTEDAVLWRHHRSIPQLPSPLIYRDVLYLLNDQGGLLTTFRPQTGEVLERGRLGAAVDSYYASPVAGDGKVYLVSESGIVTVLPAGGSLEPLSTQHLEERCYATPALAEGRVFLRTEAALYCFGKHSAG